jgi:UDP-N-acetyl-D-glucosamine dehydrogenase
MPEYVISKLMDGLNDAGKALKNSRVLVLGIAYKKNVDDMRESPAAEILKLIQAKGAIVAYSDPHVPVFPKMREYSFKLASEPLTAENLATFDAVLLATDHDRFDYDMIKQHARLIIDSRGKYREPAEHIVKA